MQKHIIAFALLFSLISPPVMAEEIEPIPVTPIAPSGVTPNQPLQDNRNNVDRPTVGKPQAIEPQRIEPRRIEKSAVPRPQAIAPERIQKPAAISPSLRFSRPAARPNQFSKRRANQQVKPFKRKSKRRAPLPNPGDKKMSVTGVESFLDGYYSEEGVHYYPDMNDNEWIFLPIQHR